MPDKDSISAAELKFMITAFCQNHGIAHLAHRIIRDVEIGEIVEKAKASKEETGDYLPRDLLQELAEQYHYCERNIRVIVSRNK